MLNLMARRAMGHLRHHQWAPNQLMPREAQLVHSATGHHPLRGSNQSVQISRQYGSNSAAYDGDGKTTVKVLNDDESHLNLINTYSNRGFRLHNNLFIHGSILLFPTNVFSWTVRRGKEITMESMMLFDIIVPKIKIVIIGYGQQGEEYDATIPVQLKKRGISCEMLATPNAVTTYNYLVHDSVHVAGAFVPVIDQVDMTTRDVRALYEHKRMYTEHNHIRERTHLTREYPYELKQLAQKTVMKDKDKKKFDDD